MNRMECVRVNMGKDNGRERGEEKQEKNGNRQESGNKEENKIEGENRIKEWFVKERGIRVQESGVDMEQDERWNENRMGERG